jgi:phosphoribosylformylglycinamidine synthase
MTFGYDPTVSSWSPWHGSQIAVLHSLARLAALGGSPETARLTFQEYFERTTDPQAWGKPAAALLGALSAQIAAGTPAIGGKDSMSGTFKDLKVPPTLISFAVNVEETENITSGAFKTPGNKVYLLAVPAGDNLEPDFKSFILNSRIVHELNKIGMISAMYPVAAGGIAEAVSKMCFGNHVGFSFAPDAAEKLSRLYNIQHRMMRESGFSKPEQLLFLPLYGSLLAETFGETDFGLNSILLGETVVEPEIRYGACRIPLDRLINAWEHPLTTVFPQVSTHAAQHEFPLYARREHASLTQARKHPEQVKKGTPGRSAAGPRVIIPVFPGTNCEYDMARAFMLAGGDARIFVFRNNTPQALAESLAGLRQELSQAHILALAGGFSAGDEPDGSGKFIANVLREPHIRDEVMELLEKRDGLILGICNGFQALVKTGLLPYGRILDPAENMPTLTYNTVGRHISRICETRIVSALSPWARHPSVLLPRTHLVPISHGEGRIIMKAGLAQKLFRAGQIFSQYTNSNGIPAVAEPENPNGSAYAIEGMTSPDGRVLGKMGHSERTIGTGSLGSAPDLMKNIQISTAHGTDTQTCQNIFAAGVSYFTQE